ncbi:MAG TPA: FtsX-like permease family protein [Ilumatobacteraceae bacterium]|nr:FtsX-like permease family protein [Ilumatobacteraceae bacterium]
MIGKLTRKSMRARWGRSVFIGLAIMLGVSFVAGSFVLADSLRSTFDNLFSELNENVDLEVRATLTVDNIQALRDPIAASIADDVAAVDGVAIVEPSLARFAQMLDDDGDPIETQGAPALGVSWTGPSGISGVVLKDGEAPDGPGEVAIDKATADKHDFDVGDEIDIVFDAGTESFRIVGLVGLGNADGFGGATLALFDPPTAQQVLSAGDTFDAIDMKIADGANVATVQAAIEEILPPLTEVVTGEQVAEEASDDINTIISIFGNGLLAFAFVTTFVSAFIINNVFGITISQRLRELALMRAVGASTKQVRRMVIAEALIISVTATVLGILGGLGVAKGLVALFNAAGAGFPDTALILAPRTVIFAVIVGVGITLLSVLVPARRAAKIPPVAAMRPELGFAALGASRRLVLGTIVTVVGALLFVTGLFLNPGGTVGLIAFAGGGALLIFLGIASLSTTVARPVSRLLGAPIQKLFGTPGLLARENASRAPRRTARTASALMIGVALVSAASVFASSLRDTFGRILDRAITADYIVTDESFQGLPPLVEENMAQLDELQAVSPFRSIFGTIDDSDKQFSAVDPVAFPQLADLDVSAGGFEGLVDGDGFLLHEDSAGDLDVAVGDSVDVTFQNGVERSLTVSGIFDDGSLGSNYYISISTLEAVSDLPPRDQFVLAKLADGVDPDIARTEIQAAIEEFPQADLQTNAEFRKQQEEQINQLLAIITGLLSMAMVIALVGIAITLALSVFERTREIGLLRAVGMTRRQLRRTVRWEAVIVSVFGAVVGIVVGLALGIALSLAVPASIIDGITVPYSTIITIVVAAVFAGVIAAWYPARKASKMDVLEAIATE